MNKELTPLKALTDLRIDAGHHLDDHVEYLNKRLDVIETALERLKELDSVYTLTNHNGKFYVVIDKTEFNQMLKRIKALQIIKECCIVAEYPDNTYELAFCRKICIEKEEYDLLKEIL